MVNTYRLFVDKGVNLSLHGCYTFYTPSMFTWEGVINDESIRHLLLILGLLMDKGVHIDIQFGMKESEAGYVNSPTKLFEDIESSEHKIERFIKEVWGFYSGEMLISEWVKHMEFVIGEYEKSLIT